MRWQARPRIPQNQDAVRVRPLLLSDVDACAEIMLGLPLWQRYRLRPDEARALFERALAGPSRAQVAERRGRVIGFVVYSTGGTFDRSGYVRALGVRADGQGGGVGSRLMGAAEEEILAGGPNVFLLVSPDNAPARRFYERRGYQKVGEIPDYVGPGLTELLYRKTLGPIAPG